jgi:hypothetical protein
VLKYALKDLRTLWFSMQVKKGSLELKNKRYEKLKKHQIKLQYIKTGLYELFNSVIMVVSGLTE